jgi:sugar lactone lactonase YvrE
MKNHIYALSVVALVLSACTEQEIDKDKAGRISSDDYEVSTYVGGTRGDENGDRQTAKIYSPSQIAVDKNGNLFFTDSHNYKIKKIDLNGNVTTVAGRVEGYAEGPALEAKFIYPWGIAIDNDGTLFVSDSNRVRKITTAGIVSTIAGTATAGYADGTGEDARFNTPAGLALDGDGNLYVADMYNSRIRKITPSGVVSTVAGSVDGFADGTGDDAKFDHAAGITMGNDGNLYVADGYNHRVRKVTPTGVVSTVAGDGKTYEGTSAESILLYPMDLVMNKEGFIYVSDVRGEIMSIAPNGEVTTFAGSLGTAYLDGTATDAKFGYVFGLEVTSDGTVYACDPWNDAIRKIQKK